VFVDCHPLFGLSSSAAKAIRVMTVFPRRCIIIYIHVKSDDAFGSIKYHNSIAYVIMYYIHVNTLYAGGNRQESLWDGDKCISCWVSESEAKLIHDAAFLIILCGEKLSRTRNTSPPFITIYTNVHTHTILYYTNSLRCWERRNDMNKQLRFRFAALIYILNYLLKVKEPYWFYIYTQYTCKRHNI